jgi:hypothetical protein
MMQKFMDEQSSLRVWTNYIPKSVSKYFIVRRLRKVGCTSETCNHFSHDPNAPIYELTPIWPVVSISSHVSEKTKETVFYSTKTNEVILILEEDLEGRFWDRVFVPEL